ncbi:predicted protein [Naegleria gruberi]|uniref:Predicted protein n=1 Tax=Naegleria gruberi TaxID=5762 RepID=D2VMW6_NAEGR|nr:uncharacterized protein NAEGRDRAFT_50870 [Naegleria gruberi]EFC41894.1 predicted protein [Naegleria gruberi]|eukprot:XP_002674638.1 predicted protein [Naegleria gruberi strain NEG-M]
MLGVQVISSISSLATNDVISNVEYSWSQVSGPAFDLASVAGYLNRPQLKIPGKVDKLSLDNGIKSGNTYGFSLTAKVTTPSLSVTITESTTIVVQQDPKLTFLLQDANTNQIITSGIAGKTNFKLTITGNSNPYSDSDFGYGFGFADSDAITILTEVSPNPATFTLPLLSGKNSIDLYVATYGSKSVSIQKLTTIPLTNPVANLPTSQAITLISNLLSTNSSVGDLLGVASLLNTVSTSDNSQISTKAAIRNTIITSLSKDIASGDLGAVVKVLESVTSVAGELTQTSANKALDALIESTRNSKFSPDIVKSVINVASNALLLTSNDKSSLLAKSIGAKLTPALTLGDVVTASSANIDLAVAKGASLIPVGSSTIEMATSKTRFLACFLITDKYEFNYCIQAVLANARTVQPTKKRESSLKMVSKVYDFIPLFENGTIADGIVNGYIKITIPYSGTMTPICGRYDRATETVSVDTTIITTNQNGSVVCQTKNLSGNVLLAPLAQVSGSVSISMTLKYFSCLIVLILFLL